MFFWGPMTLFIGPPNSAKHKFLGKFRSHSTSHIFKNYFITVFLIINFQLLANNRYPRSLYWVEVVAQKFNLRTGGKTFGLKVKTRILTLHCYSVTTSYPMTICSNTFCIKIKTETLSPSEHTLMSLMM